MPAHYWPSRTNGGHLGLAKEHTVLQGLGWEARIANENKLNTRLLASDKTAAHAAWLADISRNHACQLRYAPGAGPVPRALPVGTGGAFVPVYDTPPRPRRPKSAAAAVGGGVAAAVGGGVAARPASARRDRHRPPPVSGEVGPAPATVPLSAAAKAARAEECKLHVERMASGRNDEGVYMPTADSPPMPPPISLPPSARAQRSLALREVLAASHRSRAAARRGEAQEAKRSEAEAAAEAAAVVVHAAERRRVLKRLQAAVVERRRALGPEHPHTIVAVENLRRYRGGP